MRPAGVDWARDGAAMALDWLFGPRILFRSDDMVVFNALRLDVSDVAELHDLLAERVGPTEIRRMTRSDHPDRPDFWQFQIPRSELLEASDADLKNLRIESGPRPGEGGPVTVTLGEAGGAFFAPRVDSQVRSRIIEILTENGRRRLQPWRLYVALRVVVALIVFGLWAWLAMATWPLVPATVLIR